VLGITQVVVQYKPNPESCHKKEVPVEGIGRRVERERCERATTRIPCPSLPIAFCKLLFAYGLLSTVFARAQALMLL
jgi:hypothetical protein